jgi:hypothetical protein
MYLDVDHAMGSRQYLLYKGCLLVHMSGCACPNGVSREFCPWLVLYLAYLPRGLVLT